MQRAGLWQLLAAWLAIGAGAVVHAHPPGPSSERASKPSLTGCQTAQGSVQFDFEGASRSTCYVEDERTLSILVTPEHLPPINPSPWYAFRYRAAAEGGLKVHVRYIGARHRYAPKWQGQGDPAAFSVKVAEDASMASITLPPGEGIVSGQPLVTSRHYDTLVTQLAKIGKGKKIILGQSHDRRPITAVRLGNAKAPRLVVLLGRQHPPEVTGATAMDAFSLAIAKMVRSGTIDGREFQFLIVPLLNPDGVARGHWRANLGGVDLNRDWGIFKQPETRAVKNALAGFPPEVRPVLMLDFHSTNRNLFYVQGTEVSAQGKKFLATWLSGKETAIKGYPFKIEPRDANPGAGTTKNWFNATFGIPAYTYEVDDDADPAAVRAAADALAQNMIPALVLALKEVPRE
ncbi:MAG: M14 family metallopeptidase [Pseudomonadota bacterium]